MSLSVCGFVHIAIQTKFISFHFKCTTKKANFQFSFVNLNGGGSGGSGGGNMLCAILRTC